MTNVIFDQLVDIAQVRQLLESHHALTGMTYAVLDAEENVLVAVGWQDVCVRFHRVHPVTCARCRESDAHIKAHLQDSEGDVIEYRCKNGMIDVAMPIIIDGKHLATFFTGQFFYVDDRPDANFFRVRAGELGFDAKEYLQALEQVPVFSREHIRGNTLFLRDMVKVLTQCGVNNLKRTCEMEERKRFENTLLEQKLFLDSLLNAIPVPIFFKGMDARYIGCNRAFEQFLGTTRQELVGKSVFDVCTPDQAELFHAADAELFREAGTQVFETQLRDARGIDHTVIFNKAAYFDINGKVSGLIGAVMDITEHRRAESELCIKHQQLTVMAVELSLAEERERRRIAAELHDHIGQNLLLAKFKLGAQAAPFASGSQEIALTEIGDILVQSIRDIRSLTQQISPPLLAGAGLEAALEWLAKQVEDNYSLRVSFVDDRKPKPLAEEIRGVVFKAARELLINVSKHAETDSARLIIGREKDMFRLTVEDRGRGFDPSGGGADGYRENVFGLFNIRERITYLGGDFSLESKCGRGTRVTLNVPLDIENKERK